MSFKHIIPLLLLVFSVQATAAASKDCSGCDELSKIEKQVGESEKTDSKALNQAQLKATSAIEKMTMKTKKLTAAQILAIAKIARLTVPSDPAYSFYVNNLDVFEVNKAQFHKAFATFSKEEAKHLSQSLEIAIKSDQSPQDSD